MNSKLWWVLGAVAVCAGQVVACSSDFTSCTDTRTCVDQGGAGVGGKASAADGGAAPATAGKGGGGNGGRAGIDAAGSTGESGAGGEPGEGGAGGEVAERGEGGEGGEGGAPYVTPVLFGRCSSLGQIACDAAASAQRLACDGSKWQAGTTCAAGLLCNSTDGMCLPKVAECAALLPGQVTCRNDVQLTCGPDLVSAEVGKECAAGCKDGVCQAPKCGDGKVQDNEACDDGNLLPGDGCSATCSWEPKALALGNGFSCALGWNGVVKCWGSTQYGQLGSSETQNRGDDPGETGKLLPVQFGPQRTAKAISAGNDSACALLDNNSVMCWGRNDVGQLGTTDINNRGTADATGKLTAIDFGSGRTAIAVSINRYEACAILDDGTLRCWGQNTYGALGQDKPDNYQYPKSVPAIDLGGHAAQAVGISPWANTCALLDNALVECWGDNGEGELCSGADDGVNYGVGNDPNEMSGLTPFGIAAGRTIKTIVTGERTTCALLDDGTVKCWGENSDGEGGAAEACFSPSTLNDWPFLDLGGAKAKSLSLTEAHLCLVLDNGDIRCFGRNQSGQLGIGSIDDQGATFQGSPQVVSVPLGLKGDMTKHTALQVATGTNHTCAILDDGLVRCWGANTHGELGVGDTQPIGNSGGLANVKLTPVNLTF